MVGAVDTRVPTPPKGPFDPRPGNANTSFRHYFDVFPSIVKLEIQMNGHRVQFGSSKVKRLALNVSKSGAAAMRMYDELQTNVHNGRVRCGLAHDARGIHVVTNWRRHAGAIRTCRLTRCQRTLPYFNALLAALLAIASSLRGVWRNDAVCRASRSMIALF